MELEERLKKLEDYVYNTTPIKQKSVDNVIINNKLDLEEVLRNMGFYTTRTIRGIIRDIANYNCNDKYSQNNSILRLKYPFRHSDLIVALNNPNIEIIRNIGNNSVQEIRIMVNNFKNKYVFKTTNKLLDFTNEITNFFLEVDTSVLTQEQRELCERIRECIK